MSPQVFSARTLSMLMPAPYYVGRATRIKMAIHAAYHIDKPRIHNKRLSGNCSLVFTFPFITYLYLIIYDIGNIIESSQKVGKFNPIKRSIKAGIKNSIPSFQAGELYFAYKVILLVFR